MEVHRVRSPKVLSNPAIRRLFEAGLSYSVFGIAPFEEVLPDLKVLIRDPKAGVFIGFDDKNRPKSMGIITLPPTKLITCPQVIALYSTGGRELTRATIAAGLEFIRSNGYIKFWAINSSGHSDKAWKRVFRLPGDTGKVASLYEFRIGD